MKFNKSLILTMFLSFSSLAIASSGGDDAGNSGNNYLARAGVFQYTCITFAGSTNSNGDVIKTGLAKSYLNYLGDSLPSPMIDSPFYVCHDDQIYGAEDSYEYPRLELIPNVANFFSRFDTRFARANDGKLVINSIIDDRMSAEHGIITKSDLFYRYEMTRNSYGFLLKPFINLSTHEYFCPSSKYSDNPYVKVITDYTGDTEGLYIGEVERQVLSGPINSVIINTWLMVTESKIMKYGFFLRDGVKHRVSLESLIETDTVMFYYPFSDSQDPLVKGNRKVVVINQNNSGATKKLGCIFKSEK